MKAGTFRNLTMLIACGGLMFGSGCASFVTESLLRLGLTTAVSQILGLSI